MNPRNTQEITLYDNVTPVAVTSSTDATPIVITATSHGFNTGDRVLIFGHTTNIAANGIYKVTKLSANTFSLQDEFTGANIAGSGAGAGASGVAVKAPPVILTQSFTNVDLQLDTTGSASMTLKVAVSNGKPESTKSSPRWDFPNMGATVSPSNPYSFVQVAWLDNNSSIPGSTGIALAGTDVDKMYQVNSNLQKYLTVIPVAWTAGAISLKALLSSI